MNGGVWKGIAAGLFGTVFTLLFVVGLTAAGAREEILSYAVDLGLIFSCLLAGYKGADQSGRVWSGGLAAGGYALVGILLLALYFPILFWGAVQVGVQSVGVGLLAGFLAVRGQGRPSLSAGCRSGFSRQDYHREWLEEKEEEDAFAWWEREGRRQIKRKL